MPLNANLITINYNERKFCSQGGHVDFVLDFHPGMLGSTPAWGNLPKKLKSPSVTFLRPGVAGCALKCFLKNQIFEF